MFRELVRVKKQASLLSPECARYSSRTVGKQRCEIRCNCLIMDTGDSVDQSINKVKKRCYGMPTAVHSHQ